MEERKTEQPLRGGWRPGFYMKPKHVGLVFCVSLVGCMVTFGAGFIVGMGYKASEQVSPYAVTETPGSESVMQGRISNAALKDEKITFYDALTSINNVPMETTEEPEPESAVIAATPAQTPIPASPVAPVVVNGAGPQAADEDPTAGDRTGNPAPVVVPAPVLPEPTVVAQEKNSVSQTVEDAVNSSLYTDDTVRESYSVQVASFLTPERAERLIEELASKGYRAYVHPFEAPGRRLWYRVKVGKFADRATASMTLEKLGNPEAMITRE